MFKNTSANSPISLMESFAVGLERVKARLDLLEAKQVNNPPSLFGWGEISTNINQMRPVTDRSISDALDVFLNAIVEVRGRKRIENMEIVMPKWLLELIRVENHSIENECLARGEMIACYRGVNLTEAKERI